MKQKIDDSWFYSEPGLIGRICLVYVKGDGILLYPLVISIIIILFIDERMGLFMGATYWTLRALGEMIYWLLQQFGSKTYRPEDFGFSDLSNDAIYILYQTSSLVNMVMGIGALYLLTR